MTVASEYVARVHELLASAVVTDGAGAVLTLDAGCERVVEELLRVRQGRNTVFVIGNGGSSAIAAHMQSDLVKNVGVRAQAFHDVPLLTAITNDDGYTRAFSDPLALWAAAGDLLFAVSSSGRSESILRAVDVALHAGTGVCTLSGFDSENPLRRLGAINFHVDCHAYGLVESAHTVLTHLLTDAAAARTAHDG
jgi:D-sedoheptulose 7-phosphate isomerase